MQAPLILLQGVFLGSLGFILGVMAVLFQAVRGFWLVMKAGVC